MPGVDIPCRRYTSFRRHREVCAKPVYRRPTPQGSLRKTGIPASDVLRLTRGRLCSSCLLNGLLLCIGSERIPLRFKLMVILILVTLSWKKDAQLVALDLSSSGALIACHVVGYLWCPSIFPMGHWQTLIFLEFLRLLIRMLPLWQAWRQLSLSTFILGLFSKSFLDPQINLAITDPGDSCWAGMNLWWTAQRGATESRSSVDTTLCFLLQVRGKSRHRQLW